MYYYFKSKDSIILAVIERRKKQLSALFADWNNQPDVRGRLSALVNYAGTLADESAKFGDSLGSLCQELGKLGGAIGQSASQLMMKLFSGVKNNLRHWESRTKTLLSLL